MGLGTPCIGWWSVKVNIEDQPLCGSVEPDWVPDLLLKSFTGRGNVIQWVPKVCPAINWPTSLYGVPHSHIHVVALQCTLKEAQHDLMVTQKFTRERTEQSRGEQQIGQWWVLALSPTHNPWSWLSMPTLSPRRMGMTWWADHFFKQEHLKCLRMTEQHPAWLNDRLITQNSGQYEPTLKYEDNEYKAMISQLDQDVEGASMIQMLLCIRKDLSPSSNAAGRTVPCRGSAQRSDVSSGIWGAGTWVFPSSQNPQRKMLSLTEIGTAK